MSQPDVDDMSPDEETLSSVSKSSAAKKAGKKKRVKQGDDVSIDRFLDQDMKKVGISREQSGVSLQIRKS